jgi:hypothetical protein
MANDNRGRRVVVIGQSAGASHLRRLIADEIERFRPGRDVGARLPTCQPAVLPAKQAASGAMSDPLST